MKDRYERTIEYMRISITDRCNLRCRYCMPEDGIDKIAMSRLLTYEEIVRICEQAVHLGIDRFKVTGGEPLVRRGCPQLIGMIKSIPGVRQVTLTTNGQLLGQYLDELTDAGVDGINVSLDSLREDRYSYITRGGELAPVMESIDRAISAGVRVKVNALIQRDLNEDEIFDFAQMAFDREMDVRFIETMPVGFADADAGLSNEVLLLTLQEKWPELETDERTHGNGPAIYYHIPGKAGSVGFISALHGKFCEKCNRIRLTSGGLLKPCLCYDDSVDLLGAIRNGRAEELRHVMEEAIMKKPEGHCFEERDSSEGDSMVRIGG